MSPATHDDAIASIRTSRSSATARWARRWRHCSRRAGHRVEVFERFTDIYRLPRAVHLDHEIMRLLQSLELADELADEMIPVHDYQWFGADGEPLLRFETQSPARSGWESRYMFFQPELETALDRHRMRGPEDHRAPRLGRRGARRVRRRAPS